MDSLAREYADQAHFLFIYTREAHPDMYPDHPAHQTLEQKFQHARDLQKKFDTPRTILIDTLDGDVHRAWSGLSNMSWIIDHTGYITYKAAWTSATHVRGALDYTIRSRDLKRPRSGSAPFYQETVMWTVPRQEG